ncbi:MAG: 50S ribosomal protein L18e [Nanoarchaeota archaeon]
MAIGAKRRSYSIRHIKSKIVRKTNPSFLNMLQLARKQKNWVQYSHMLSGPTRSQVSINLSSISEQTKAGDTVIIPGKVLSSGNLTHKVRICALGISASAKAKLKESKSEYVSIAEEIKVNPKAEGLKVIVGAQNG